MFILLIGYKMYTKFLRIGYKKGEKKSYK